MIFSDQTDHDGFASTGCGGDRREDAPGKQFRFIGSDSHYRALESPFRREPGNARRQDGLQLLALTAQDRCDIALAGIHLADPAFQLRKPVQLVETGKHARAVAGDRGGQSAIFVRRGAEYLLLDDFGKALDGVNRRAQLVQQLPDPVGLG